MNHSPFFPLLLLGALSLPSFGDVRLTNVPRPSRESRSGLITGDIVKSINGVPMESRDALRDALENAPDGAEILVFRVDRELKLRLAAPPKAKEPHRLKTDWDKVVQEEDRMADARRELLRLLKAPAPDAAAIRRCMEGNDIEQASFSCEQGILTLLLREGRVFLRLTDDELSALYELGAPGKENCLPAELTELLNELTRND